MKIISFSNLKGGTGKSNVLFNMCGMLSRRGKKVLVIDLDPQGDISCNLGKNRHHNEYSIANVFYDLVAPEDLIETTNVKSVSLIKGGMKMTAIENELINEDERELFLSKYIRKFKLVFEKFDYILIDTNPSFSVTNQNAYIVSDHIYIISDTSTNSVEKAIHFIVFLDQLSAKMNLDSNVGAFILNRYKRFTLHNKKIMQLINNHPVLREAYIGQPIRDSIKFAEAEDACEPISKGDGYRDYTNLIKALEKKGVL